MSDQKPKTGLRRPSSVNNLRAAAVAGRAAPVEAPIDQVPATVRPVKPIRLNVDIDRELHKWLKGFALESDTDVAHVVRALLAEIQGDEVLAAKVRARVSS